MRCLRIRYTKRGKIRFIGHRDVARIWERTLRKANIPVLYSQGFSPHPRISFGLALPTGFESEAEYVDIYLGEEFFMNDFDSKSIQQDIDRALPVGMDALGIGIVSTSEDSLQEAVDTCIWEVRVSGVSVEEFKKIMDEMFSSDSLNIERERKGKLLVEDVRQQVHSMDITEEHEDGVTILTELGTKPRVLRPTDLLKRINSELRTVRVLRKEQLTLQGNQRIEPLSIELHPAAPNEVLA
ncbi:MAG: TIGR03936 family radical SAM-associated protein [Actinomycetota bacterium]|nr:TIGR03936 family radical SAM-associated protein [Actinomycetota bacterium]